MTRSHAAVIVRIPGGVTTPVEKYRAVMLESLAAYDRVSYGRRKYSLDWIGITDLPERPALVEFLQKYAYEATLEQHGVDLRRFDRVTIHIQGHSAFLGLGAYGGQFHYCFNADAKTDQHEGGHNDGLRHAAAYHDGSQGAPEGWYENGARDSCMSAYSDIMGLSAPERFVVGDLDYPATVTLHKQRSSWQLRDLDDPLSTDLAIRNGVSTTRAVRVLLPHGEELWFSLRSRKPWGLAEYEEGLHCHFIGALIGHYFTLRPGESHHLPYGGLVSHGRVTGMIHLDAGPHFIPAPPPPPSPPPVEPPERLSISSPYPRPYRYQVAMTDAEGWDHNRVLEIPLRGTGDGVWTATPGPDGFPLPWRIVYEHGQAKLQIYAKRGQGRNRPYHLGIWYESVDRTQQARCVIAVVPYWPKKE